MLSISITLLTAILTAVTSAEHHEQIAVADGSSLSSTPPSVQSSDQLATLLLGEGDVTEQDPQALRERDPTFGWYSRKYNQNNLAQWIFGNVIHQFNISISVCMEIGEVAGVYQFMNGSNSTEATFGDIHSDLGYGDTLSIPATVINQTLINAEAAYDDISTFLLDFIICSGNSPLGDELRRQLLADDFISNSQVATLILQGASTAVIYYFCNGIGLHVQQQGMKVLLGGIGTVSIVLVLGILEIFRQENLIQPYEAAFMASVFVARVRGLILKATQNGRTIGGACLPVTGLADAAAQAGSGAAPVQELGVVAGADVPPIQATCADPH